MSEDLTRFSKEELLKLLIESKAEQHVDKNELIARLRTLFQKFNEKENFQPGDLVVWKEGLKNKKRPSYNMPAIVIEHLDEPIIADINETGSPYFREPLDLIAAVIDENDSFSIFYFDSRRFRKYEGDA